MLLETLAANLLRSALTENRVISVKYDGYQRGPASIGIWIFW